MKREPKTTMCAKPITVGQSWDDCVQYLLGPKLEESAADRERNALELAAAALRAAGEHVLAENLLD
jgi:hypothetical protein